MLTAGVILQITLSFEMTKFHCSHLGWDYSYLKSHYVSIGSKDADVKPCLEAMFQVQ